MNIKINPTVRVGGKPDLKRDAADKPRYCDGCIYYTQTIVHGRMFASCRKPGYKRKVRDEFKAVKCLDFTKSETKTKISQKVKKNSR